MIILVCQNLITFRLLSHKSIHRKNRIEGIREEKKNTPNWLLPIYSEFLPLSTKLTRYFFFPDFLLNFFFLFQPLFAFHLSFDSMHKYTYRKIMRYFFIAIANQPHSLFVVVSRIDSDSMRVCNNILVQRVFVMKSRLFFCIQLYTMAI